MFILKLELPGILSVPQRFKFIITVVLHIQVLHMQFIKMPLNVRSSQEGHYRLISAPDLSPSVPSL